MKYSEQLAQKIFNAITSDWKGTQMKFPIFNDRKMKYVDVTITAKDLLTLIKSKITKASQ